MTAVLILGVIFGSVIIVIALIAGSVIQITKIKKGGSFRQGERIQAEEAKLIQEIHQGLARMEERIEALETILFDQEVKREKKEERTDDPR
ncbi:MAG: phage-shock protein [Candidatus Hydrogenedentota bacterium]|nr:MAG: phage-shock protein [Candidatus Hydrogenedentota bacterium]